MIFKYFFNCFCPTIIDKDEIRENSDESIETIPPPDFIPVNEFNHHRPDPSSIAWNQFISNT